MLSLTVLFLPCSAWFHNGGERHVGCVADQFLLRVGESVPARDVGVVPNLEDALRDAFDDAGVTPASTPEDLPSLDEFLGAEREEEDEVLVFRELEPVVRTPPPEVREVRVSAPRCWSRTLEGGLRQSPPRTVLFDL